MANRALSALRSDLRERLDEATPTFWSDAILNTWLNEGAKEIARRTECLPTSQSLAVTAGVTAYNAPTNMVRIHKVDHRRSGDDIWPLEYRDLGSMDSVWGAYRTAQGRPVAWTMWGPAGAATMTIYPSPSESTVLPNGLVIYYYRLPASMVGDASVVDLPEGWDELPILYAEYVALRKDRQPTWQEAKAEFEAKMQEMMVLTHRLTDQVGSYYGEPMRTGLPAWLVDPGGW